MRRVWMFVALSLPTASLPNVAAAHPFGSITPPLRLMAPAEAPTAGPGDADKSKDPALEDPWATPSPAESKPPRPAPYGPPPPPSSNDDDDDDDDDETYDRDPPTPGMGMMLGGALTFSVSWLGFGIYSLLEGSGLGFIPLAGPWLELSSDDDLAPVYVIDGLAQIIGVGVLIGGIVRFRNTRDC